MPVVQINQNGETSFRHFKQGESLQSVLAEQSLIHSPCGGKGTCGKCQVNVDGKGEVLACTFYPKTDVVVNLANNRKSQILSQNSSSIISSSPNKEVTHSDQEYGLAIDIGTTSVVFYWVNLRLGNIDQVRGVENPQVSYGADVITRINKCSDAKVLKALQKLMVNLIGDEFERFIINDLSLKKMSVSANACMLHILAGVNPMPMAFAPFVAPFTEAKSIKAKELGLQLKSEIFVELLPSASAFVGADIVSGITSLNPPANIRNYLFIDIGTNGEMAVITPKDIVACATAAGPAFEGANIKFGMGAFEGAISEYAANTYMTIANKPAIGICGSGLLDVLAFLLHENHLSSDGLLPDDYVLVPESKAGVDTAICITPQDIREVQLAKSAIRTGINILLKEAGLNYADLDSVYLAGGFGNYMKPESAIAIGLIPHDDKVPIVPVGNTSGAGAVMHVVDPVFTDKLQLTLNRMKTIDLSTHPDFELEFAMNMYF